MQVIIGFGPKLIFLQREKVIMNDEPSFDEIVAQWKKVPVHKVMTEEIIDSTSDNDLGSVIINHLNAKVPDYTQEYEVVMSLSTPQRNFYCTFFLEGEVVNGGFNQYYENTRAQFADLLPEALREIGAPELADLLTTANRVYMENYAEITNPMDGTVEGFVDSYDNNPLNELDKVFFDLEAVENLHDLRLKYVRDSKGAFVD